MGRSDHVRAMGRRRFLKALSLSAFPPLSGVPAIRKGSVATVPFPEAVSSGSRWEPPFSELPGWITPVDRFFVRCHLGVPRLDLKDWKLVVAGQVERRLEVSYRDLLQLPRVSGVITFECAENLPGGGMVGNAEWAGISMAALLQRAEVKPGAVEVILEGADFGIDEHENVPVSYARSISLDKALAPDTLLAFEMNRKMLTPEHGYPVRAIVPAWYAMAHVKWLRRIQVVDRPFEGFYMTKRYITAKRDPNTGEFLVWPVTEMGLKSQIARPKNKELLSLRPYTIRGAAWTGRGRVERVEVSTDAGGTWKEATLGKERAPCAWLLWEYLWQSPLPGEHSILVRAFSDQGETQPTVEDRGRINRYSNRWLHRVNVRVSSGIGQKRAPDYKQVEKMETL